MVERGNGREREREDERGGLEEREIEWKIDRQRMKERERIIIF